MPRPDGTEWVNTYIEPEVKKKLRILAAEKEVSVAQLVRSLIEDYVKRKGK